MINYQNNKPFVEGVAIENIASSHATPTYVYSQTKIEESKTDDKTGWWS